ncbi:MAG: hypothetical protein H6711_02430 [Myxococcales bacterium]|nr:hypothetical protein [Myxococcales bacterium]
MDRSADEAVARAGADERQREDAGRGGRGEGDEPSSVTRRSSSPSARASDRGAGDGPSSATSAGAGELARPPRWLVAVLALAVTLLGLWLVWPLARGVMPLSADHPVHLTRAWLFGQILADFELRGWSSTWFFGAPIGELYPPLGDLIVALFRALSFGGASWERCYAWMVALVFVLQGLALVHVGATLGRGGARGRAMAFAGPIAGAIAGALALVDAGAYREGGWTYTMLYGVWPQALATSLGLLCLSEAARARLEAGTPGAGRHLACAALAGGGAILAHPMSLPTLALAAALGVPILASIKGQVAEDMSKSPSRRAAGARAQVTLEIAVIGGLALAVAAWWLLPMLAHRGWMASYGWLHAPLDAMVRMAAEGRWAQHMPAAVGHAATLGLLFTALRGHPLARLLAAWSLCLWLGASADAFWALRLDHLGAGFTHIQYQRLLIAAKPGLFLLAGLALVGLARAAAGLWRSRLRAHIKAPVVVALAGAILVLGSGMVGGSVDAMRRHHVGEVQVERFPGKPEAEAAYAELLAWLAERERERARAAAPGEVGRIAFRAHRNAHWFMDSPLTTEAATYKIGFTPGDNFVHKPEAASDALLRRLGVRYLVSMGRGLHQFGPFAVRERTDAEGITHLEGPGEVEVIGGSVDAGDLRLRIRGAEAGATRLVLHVGGYPRWELRQGGALLPWVEVPAITRPGGEAVEATPEARRRGELRGGKAEGDDGSEPTLIAAAVGDGDVELRYVRWRVLDLLGLGITVAALLALLALIVGRGEATLARLGGIVRRALPGWVQAAGLAIVIAALGVRWLRADARESGLASAWLSAGRAAIDPASGGDALRAGPLKTEMLIRPAIVVRPRRAGPAIVTFPGVDFSRGELRGYVALDDDAAKDRRGARGTHHLKIDARTAGAAAEAWTTLVDLKLPHAPGRTPLVLTPPPGAGAAAGAAVDLRVTIVSEGEAPPALGFNLGLAGGDPP